MYFNYFSTSVQYIYITDKVIDGTILSIYSREFEKNYCKCH